MDKDNLEILLEDNREKFDLVLEGHSSLHKRIDKAEQNLNDKISLVDFKVGVLHQKIDSVDKKLSEKIDAVAADLATHRADTEVHEKRYKVSDG
jgi:hypothetical protein